MYAVVATTVVLGSSGCGKHLKTEDEVKKEFINGLRRFGEVLDYELDEYFSSSYTTGYMCGGWSGHYGFIALMKINGDAKNAIVNILDYLKFFANGNEILIEVFDNEEEAREHYEQLLSDA